MNNSFSSRLKRFRSMMNLSQEEIAKKLSISTQSYLNYEIGKSQPKLPFLENLRKIYNVNINWLIDGEGSVFEIISFDESVSTNLKAIEFFYYFNKYDLVQFSALASLADLKIKHPELFNDDINSKIPNQIKKAR